MRDVHIQVSRRTIGKGMMVITNWALCVSVRQTDRDLREWCLLWNYCCVMKVTVLVRNIRRCMNNAFRDSFHLMPLSQSATFYFRRWLTDDNDKWFIVDWLFDVTHSFDVRLKKEKIKHKQTWMYQTLARKWKFFTFSSLFKGTVCHHWCDIRSNLHVRCICWSKIQPNIHISFC